MTEYESVDTKLARAIDHLENLETELRRWYETNPFRMVPQPNPSGLNEDLIFQIKNPMPPAINALLGDCIHNFRSVLDHLAMALAVDNGADPYDFTVQFPIRDTFKGYHGYEQHEAPISPAPRGTGAYQIRALGPAAQTFIEGLQPYNGKGRSCTLIELNQLDNRDKHRSILDLNPEAVATMKDSPGTTVTYEDPLRLKDGARFATITFDVNYSDVKTYTPVPTGIGVEDSNRTGWLDIPGFPRGQLLPHVREIVEEAKRLFP